MPQTVVIQVGQCGNQIGCRFWELALREHAKVSKGGVYDEALSTFFRNVDKRGRDIPLGDGKQPISSLKARAVLIDMEEGVVNEILKGPLGEVFDSRQLITSVSGSGNNWAVGYHKYGQQYREQISDTIRHAVELCDCLQSFLVLHSMGGGTGSGLGTFVLELLENEYPDVYRFVTAVYPSADDDVVTSPYNSVLAMYQLTEYADCVLPIENQALSDICQKVNSGQSTSSRVKAASAVTEGSDQSKRPWDKMNNIVANMLLSMTSSSRFAGSLNVDVNEITMNLVPFPKLHFLVPSLTPLYNLADVRIPPRRLDQMFTDAFSKDYQLIKADPKRGVYLACALLLRGNVEISDVRRNIERIKPTLNFAHWNKEGWKTGLCSVPPVGLTHSLLSLANNSCVHQTFGGLKDRFVKLYRSKAFVHHFTQEGMEAAHFKTCLSSLTELKERYANIDIVSEYKAPARMKVL